MLAGGATPPSVDVYPVTWQFCSLVLRPTGARCSGAHVRLLRAVEGTSVPSTHSVKGAHQGLNMPIATWMGFLNTKAEKYVLMFCKNTYKWLARGWGEEWGQK